MQGYAEVLAADRRLAILRLLVEAGGESGESVLEKGLHMLGHRAGVDRDQVRRDLRDLADRDCLVTELFAEKVMVAKITRRGVSAAEGVIEIAGVAKPSMGL
jgi:hypothetical protein